MVTFEPLDIQQSYIPLLKALKCGINAVGAQGRGCSSLLCHAHLKMSVLLQKQANERFILILAVYVFLFERIGILETRLIRQCPRLCLH